MESRYNDMYKELITKDLQKYLQGKRKRKDRYLIARYKCGNELIGNRHRRMIKDRTYRICKNGEENLHTCAKGVPGDKKQHTNRKIPK